jgi:hypothetical protein
MWKLVLKRKDLEEGGDYLGGGKRLERISMGKKEGNGWVTMIVGHYLYEDVIMEAMILLINM